MIIKFIKSEIVTVISFALAVLSMFFVRPSAEYLSYIDMKTIFILLIMMIIVSILRCMNVLYIIAKYLIERVTTIRSLCEVLIMICFFSSMFITNDVALLTFVPLTIDIFRIIKKDELLIPVITMQTIAANLGSSLTPIGNPQNIFLFNKMNIGIANFVMMFLPYAILAFVLILIFIFILFKSTKIETYNLENKNITLPKNLSQVLKNVDVFLLLTFIFLFIFIGNISRITAINNFISTVVSGREFILAFLSSQVISNVPATILLSKFTDNYREVFFGVNIGGLGTLIASMASLISYKFYARLSCAKPTKYIKVFTFYNMIFIVFSSLLYIFMHK